MFCRERQRKPSVPPKEINLWLEAMKDEMKSMNANEVWDLVEIPKGAKTVGCKWVYKTKYDPNGNVESIKPDLWQKDLHKEKR